jgi:hypothetical protein
MNEEQVFEALPSEEDNSQDFQATVVTNEPVEAESAPEEIEASEVEEESGKGKDPWYKRRIDELTRDKHEARRQAERLEKILEQQEAMLRQQMPQNAPEAARGPVPPNPNDFAGGQFDPRYMDAMLQYTREAAVVEARQAVAQEYEQRQAQQAFVAAQAKLETSEAAARAKYADYDAVIDPITSDPRLAQNQTIRQAVLGMENGPEIAYVLGRHLDVAYEIASMNPIQAGMKLAELMNRAPRKVTNAPNPINPLNGAATSSPRGSKNYAEMTTAEYIAARNAEEIAARQAMYKR